MASVVTFPRRQIHGGGDHYRAVTWDIRNVAVQWETELGRLVETVGARQLARAT